MTTFLFIAFIFITLWLININSKLNKQSNHLRQEITVLRGELNAYKKQFEHFQTFCLHKFEGNTDVKTQSIAPKLEDITSENASEIASENLQSQHSEVESLATKKLSPLPSALAQQDPSYSDPLLNPLVFEPLIAEQPLTSTSTPATPATPPLPLSSSAESAESAQATLSQSQQITDPDEQSIPMVTSLFNSAKNWFFGGNLVVRVGVIVLLVGVVLLLRLLSNYFNTPIEVKLAVIVAVGLGLAGLGLKLVKKRFAYGITLQGTGLAIAYLTTFFAYRVYHVLGSFPSFVALGVLAGATVALAVRQNAFPLALLALSGAFFAPILTSTDSGSLVALFGYYLLINVAVAWIAHYRTWRVLNLLAVTVTFGFAYYLGLGHNLMAEIHAERWQLVAIVVAHWGLYVFVVVRYTQQIIAYNLTLSPTHPPSGEHNHSQNNAFYQKTAIVFPVDVGLLFSVPILTFGLLFALLDGITHALTISSVLMAGTYLALGWGLVRRSGRYALITEGMLALGCGFLALVVPLALQGLDNAWVAFGWAVQGLALVWFGRRSLRAWSVLFGLVLQAGSIWQLFTFVDSTTPPLLSLSVSAICLLVSMFILRTANAPALTSATLQGKQALSHYASTLGISDDEAKHWLGSINQKSVAFRLVWHTSELVYMATFASIAWAFWVLILDLDRWLTLWHISSGLLFTLASLLSITIAWAVNRYRPWAELRFYAHGLLWVFYLSLIVQLPIKYEFDMTWTNIDWLTYALAILGWIVVGQAWLKTFANQHNAQNSNRFNSAGWLMTGIVMLFSMVNYWLPSSDGVVSMLVPLALVLAGLWFTQQYQTPHLHRNRSQNHDQKPNPTRHLAWFDWQRALLDAGYIFVPIVLCWVLVSNWYHDGVVWGLPYIPVLNLFDIALLLGLGYGFTVYYLNDMSPKNPVNVNSNTNTMSPHAFALKVLGLLGFWVLSSMLVRTLHAYANTPLWDAGAWDSELVQTGLTIVWTLTALVATIVASRYEKRFWWFMGIGLLGVVVLKLVLVDLSQTGAIWRVVSFITAGSLILLIGYLAPLPPAHKEELHIETDTENELNDGN